MTGGLVGYANSIDGRRRLALSSYVLEYLALLLGYVVRFLGCLCCDLFLVVDDARVLLLESLLELLKELYRLV